MKLIDEWKKVHTFFSVQAMVVVAAIQATWPAIPEDLKAHIPSFLVNGISITLLALGVVGRVIDQGGTKPADPSNLNP